MTFTYNYPMQSVTVDAVVFAVKSGKLKQLVITRGAEPFIGKMALPGGHVDPNEDLLDACVRELCEETGFGINKRACMQVGAYGTPHRDPRGHYVTVAFVCLIPFDRMLETVTSLGGKGMDDAKEILINDRPIENSEFAFDHKYISLDALDVLGNQSKRDMLEFTLYHKHSLGEQFTARHIRELHQVVRKEEIDAGNFTKIINSWVDDKVIGKVGESKVGYKGSLYSFVK